MKLAAAILAIFLAVFAFMNWQSFIGESDPRPRVKIYTYASFVGSFGPGRTLQELFQETCDCILEFETTEAGLLLQRLELDGIKNGVDLVIGFDQLERFRAEKITEWRNLQIPHDLNQNVLGLIKDSPFLPYDWAPLTFILNTSGMEEIPESISDLHNEIFRNGILLQDPRLSSPGLQFLMWITQIHGGIEGARSFLDQLSTQIYRVAPSWSQSYGLFQQGLAPMVWSYLTSPISHLEKGETQYQALNFKEGHPVQVELLGIPRSCQQCELAEEFARFLLTPESQRVIMEKNYMLPVIDHVRQGTLFADLPEVEIAPIDYREAVEQREETLRMWTELRRGL